MAGVRVRVLRVRVRVRVLCIRVRVLTKGLESESESLKIWTQVRLEYTVGLESYITGYCLYLVVQCICSIVHLLNKFKHMFRMFLSEHVIIIVCCEVITRDHSFPQKNSVNFVRRFLKFRGLTQQTTDNSVANERKSALLFEMSCTFSLFVGFIS